MSAISFVPRPANARKEHPISVKHSHKGSPFTKATGVVVAAEFFNRATGTVNNKHPAHAQYNAQIRQVVTDIEAAADNCGKKKIEPNKTNMEREYVLQLKLREARKRLNKTQDDFVQESLLPKHLPNLLKLLEAAERRVADLKAQIVQVEIRAGVHTTKRITSFIEKYCADRKNTLSPASLDTFGYTRKLVESFNAAWEFEELNPKTMREFETWLLEKNTSTNTILNTLTQLKTVAYRYGREIGLDLEALRHFHPDVKRRKANKSGVKYLTNNEVEQLLSLNLEGKRARRRDHFVFLCLTGCRFSDSVEITRSHLNALGELVFSSPKSDYETTIPLSAKVLNLLERNDFNLYPEARMLAADGKKPKVVTSNFNAMIKTICKQIPALNELVEVKKYRGGRVHKKHVPRYEAITSHVGRKTLINNSLLAGINPVAIASIVGHAGTKLIMSTYGSEEAGKERIKDL